MPKGKMSCCKCGCGLLWIGDDYEVPMGKIMADDEWGVPSSDGISKKYRPIYAKEVVRRWNAGRTFWSRLKYLFGVY